MKTKVKKLPTFTKDNIKRVSIREYLRHYKSYNEDVRSTSKDIIITNQDEDIVRITPVHPKKKPTFADLEKIMFTGGGPNLSKDIDKIVYGL